MTETANLPTHEPAALPKRTDSGHRPGGLGWRRLQMAAAAVTVVSFLIPMAIAGKVEGFLVAMAAPFVVGLVLAFFLPRVAAVFLGVLAVATLAGSAPHILQALSHPESTADFVPQTLFTLSMVVIAIAAFPAFREVRGSQSTPRAPRVLAVAAGAGALVASAVSIVAATGVDSVAAQPGDQSVVMRHFVFAPPKLSAEAGTMSVYADNEDGTRHTFTIDGLVDLNVPPHSTQRTSFEVAPGTYRFYCRPHASDMEGILVVE